ncbi:MAG: hypothetical protein FWF53_03520 [Candidatus Azobacteroides sp.]|nr:hypothetical protein [Candidatus Azobacteroides sp.]
MDNNYDFNAPKSDLPNATVVLVLGILSIVTCCCWGVIGIICGIIALVFAKSATDLYVSNPGQYTEGSYKNMNAGKICAWVGIVLSVIYLFFTIWLIVTIGINGLSDPSLIYERLGIPMPH